MRALAVFYILGWLLAVSATAMLIPAAFAVALDPVAVVEAFLFPAVVIGFVGVNMLIAFRGQEYIGGRRQSVFLLASVWLMVPLAGALPLYAAGFPEEFVPAFFEAASGFTTTGATVIVDLASVPSAIIVWRAVLQWMGGLATLLILATVLGPLVGGDLLDRQFRLVARSEQRSPRQLAETGRTIFLIYGSLTVLCFLSLLLSGLPAFDAFCLSLSTVSTGGFMPREGTIALYGSSMVEIVLAVFMVLGAVSIVWVQAVIFGRWTLVKEMREPFLIGLFVLVLGVALAVALLQESPITGISSLFDAIALGLASAASLISTSGFMVSERAHSFIPFMLVLAICVVGGGGFSTAGGLKVHRVWAMFRQLGRELRLLVYPHGVRPSAYGGESRELPDHITTELEFMHFLTFREVALLQGGQDRVPYLRAQRDFLQRHLARWVPQVRAQAEQQKAAPFFLGLIGLAEAFLLADLSYAASLAGPAPVGQPPEALTGGA